VQIIVHRSPITTTAESEESLAETIDAGYIHTLLYRRGESELADALTAHLSAQEAVVVATLLRRVLHRYTRVGFLRPYRTVLSPGDAQKMGLLATWYERAGRAGCRVWADLRTGTTVAAPPRRDLETAGAEPEPIVPPPPANTATTAERTDLMPDWLNAPETSIWRV
jgi:hypothetical protein